MPCRFCGGCDSDGHLFWDCTFPPLVEIRKHPEFHDLMELDKTSWPRYGWLPLLSGTNGGSPWAQPPAEGAVNVMECALGRYGQLIEWQLPADFDVDGAARGTVRGLDKLGNDRADESADFGRRRVPWWVIDAKRNLSGVCSRWRLVVLVLHHFFIAISRAVVNHDDGTGTVLDPLV